MAKVLIVEDSAANCLVIKSCLGPEFNFIEARSIPDASRVLERERPDIMFVSEWLPEGDGFQLVREISASVAPRPYVIFMTIDYQLLTWTHRLRNGANQMLWKPLTADEIKASITKWRTTRAKVSAAA